MSITPVVNVVGGDIDTSTIKFEAYNGSIFFDDLKLLPISEKYIVKPKETPEGYVYFHDLLVLDKGNENNLTANCALTKLTDETRGKVTVNTVMKSSNLEVIPVDYYATDIDGNVNFDIDDLPFGSWYIKPLHFNRAYESDYVVQKVVVNEKNKNPEVTFTWSKLSDSEKKHSLNVIVNHHPRRDGRKYKEVTNKIYEFELMNMDTKEVTLLSGELNDFNRFTSEPLSRGYYKVTPKVADGYISVPIHRYVRLEGNDTPSLSFYYYSNKTPLDLSPIHEIDEKIKAEVIIPTFAPINRQAKVFNFEVNKLPRKEITKEW